MWICLDCRETFEKPRLYVETHGLSTPPYEEKMGCPYCGGNYAEAHECDVCGHYIDRPYIRLANGERICDNCHQVMEIGDED